MNLAEDVRQWVLAKLPHDPNDPNDADIVQALQQKDAHDLLVIYQNWMGRHIPATPRRVEKSSSYKANRHQQTFADALAAIEADVVGGRDLTKYLSRGVRVALRLPSQRRGASDLDMLLNDWGVHHLHLSITTETDGFVKRTGPLLFARFTSDAAYFLDIADHGEWTKESVAEALVNEFPGIGGVNVLNGVIGVSREYADKEHKQLRAAGINTIRMIASKAVIGGGYNLQGHQIEAVRVADQILENVERFERKWIESEQEVRQHFKNRGFQLPSQPAFHFDVVSGRPSIVERTTGALVAPLI